MRNMMLKLKVTFYKKMKDQAGNTLMASISYRVNMTFVSTLFDFDVRISGTTYLIRWCWLRV